MEEPITDEFSGWRQKLSAPDALPAMSSRERSEVWNRLHARLHPATADRSAAPGRRREILAAASLLLVLLSALFGLRTYHRLSPANNTIASPAGLRPPALSPATPPVLAPIADRPVPLSVPRDHHPDRQRIRTGRPPAKAFPADPSFPGLAATLSIASARPIGQIPSPTEGPATTQQLQDSGRLIPAAAATQEHRLRVVHINELSNNNGNGAALAGKTPGRFKLSPWLGWRAPSSPPAKEGQDKELLRINISPNNR